MTTKISRRNLLKGMGAGVGVLALAACTPVAPDATSDSAAGDAAAPAAEASSILLWSSFSGTNGEAEQTLVDRFNEQFETQVEYQVQGSYEETAQAVGRALAANNAPDVSLLSDVWWFRFYLSENLVPLDELLETANVDVSDYQDSLINEGLREGTHWWIPFARSTPLFYYNRDLFAAAGLPDRGPETWAEFGEWAPQLNQGDVAAFVHPDSASYIAWLFQGVAWQHGGAYSDGFDMSPMTSAETIEAGEFYSGTVHEMGWARPTSDIGADFVNGQAAAMMASTGSMGGLRENAEFDFGTAFLPEAEFFGCCTGGAGLSILTSTPEENRQAAMEYIAFVSNPESTAFWAQSTGYMPVRKSAAESEEMQAYYEEFPQFRTAVEQLPLTRAQDAARVFIPNGDQIIGAGLERITVQDEEVAAVFAEVQATLEEEAGPVVEQLETIEG